MQFEKQAVLNTYNIPKSKLITHTMKKYLFTVILLIIYNAVLISQRYIHNVNIVDVENHKLQSNMTVVIQDGLISDIKPSDKIRLPENADIINASGKFLMPGLVDAHIHFFQNGGLYTRPDVIDLRKYQSYYDEIHHAINDMETKLLRYLKSGITTVIDVGANFHLLEKHNEFNKRDSLPSIYITGPLLTTYQPQVYEGLEEHSPFILTKSVEAGIQAVQKQVPYKPDFIKIWYIAGADGLKVEESARKNLPIIKAIIDESHRNNLKVAVHATERITAQLAVESGADFLVHFIDDEIVDEPFLELLKNKDITLIPTLTVSKGYNKTLGQELDFTEYELEYSDPYQLGSLMDLKHLPDTSLVSRYKYFTRIRALAYQRSDSIAQANLKLFSDAGINIATGTDAGNIGTMHAASYLSELKAMNESGMSNWQILSASSINAAKILDLDKEIGSIGKGKKAHLLLLNSNPVSALSNLKDIDRIFINGLDIDPNTLLKATPEDLAQQQLNAYNLRKIDAFLKPYADDVEIYQYPDKLMYKGKDKMRQNYARMFENTPNLHCELLGRIVQGNIVIDKERVRFGEQIVEATAIYHVEDHKIKKVYFLR